MLLLQCPRVDVVSAVGSGGHLLFEIGQGGHVVSAIGQRGDVAKAVSPEVATGGYHLVVLGPGAFAVSVVGAGVHMLDYSMPTGSYCEHIRPSGP